MKASFRRLISLMALLALMPGPVLAGAPVLPGSALETLNKLIAAPGADDTTAPPPPPETSGFSGQNYTDLPWQNSLMFDETQLDQLYNAMVGFAPAAPDQPGGVDAAGRPISRAQDRITVDANGDVFDLAGNKLGSINENNILVDLDGNMIGKVLPDKRIVDNEGNYLGRDTRVITKVYPNLAPAFYLNSVMFYTPKNWSLWLNHRRIRRGAEMKGLTVVNIHEDFVDMLWKPADLDFISPDWKEKVLPMGEGVSKDLGVPYSKEQLGELEKKLKDARAAAEKAREQAAIAQATSPQTAAAASTPAPAAPAAAGAQPVPPPGSPPTGAVELKELSIQIDPKTGEIQKDQATLLRELKEKEEQKLKAERQRQEMEDAEKKKALEEKLRKKAQELEELHRMRYANQEVDESKYRWEYKSPDGNIMIDPINKMVKFRLGINQSFVSRVLELQEGYVASTTLTPPDQAGGVPGAPAPASTGALEQQLFDYTRSPGAAPPGRPPGAAPTPGASPRPPAGPPASGRAPGLTPGAAPSAARPPGAAPASPKPFTAPGAPGAPTP